MMDWGKKSSLGMMDLGKKWSGDEDGWVEMKTEGLQTARVTVWYVLGVNLGAIREFWIHNFEKTYWADKK